MEQLTNTGYIQLLKAPLYSYRLIFLNIFTKASFIISLASSRV